MVRPPVTTDVDCVVVEPQVGTSLRVCPLHSTASRAAKDPAAVVDAVVGNDEGHVLVAGCAGDGDDLAYERIVNKWADNKRRWHDA